MNPKTRYNIGLAERKGVETYVVKENLANHADDFYNLLLETAERDNFYLHPKSYYEAILKNCEENKNGFLVAAKFKDKLLGMNLVTTFPKTAFFLFGGSSSQHRN